MKSPLFSPEKWTSPRIALALVLSCLVLSELSYKMWDDPNRVLVHDVVLYYEYLPAAFIYKDLSMSFTKNDPAFFRDKIWTEQTRVGRTVSKMTMGMAALYSPFFFIAHGLAETTGYPADGYSMPYRIALVFSSVFYAIAGLFFLMRILRKYYTKRTVALTILALGLGTNLYFYTTVDPAMSHAYSFCLFAVFIYLTDEWVSKPGWSNTAAIGLIAGMIFLVRPSNGLIFIIILLWHVDSFSALKARFRLFFHQPLKTASILLLVILVFIPQMLYWKSSTGGYLHYSYGEERFFFNDPAFFRGLFSYRKGWLVYTPVMAFALAGIVLLYFRYRKFFWPVLVFTVLNSYIIWSWWCWWYGGGFGQRAVIESYALLSIPFAATMDYFMEKNKLSKIIILLVLTILISLNIFQTFQYTKGIIHWDGMTKRAYWDTYIRTTISPAHYEQIQAPDYEAAQKGDR
jgi:hypothetical protein